MATIGTQKQSFSKTLLAVSGGGLHNLHFVTSIMVCKELSFVNLWQSLINGSCQQVIYLLPRKYPTGVNCRILFLQFGNKDTNNKWDLNENAQDFIQYLISSHFALEFAIKGNLFDRYP